MNEPNVDLTVDRLAREILEYLQKNPRSSDTIEGIEHWWLREKQYSRAILRAALEYLVRQNRLHKQQQVHGGVYSLPKTSNRRVNE